MAAALFDGVLFHFSSSLPIERSTELKDVLLQNGAKQAKSIHIATHIITDTNNFEGCQDVGAHVSVVTDMWVERSLILEKLQGPSHYSADPAMIFSGVVACATDISSTDIEVLSAGITALGGQWRTALTRDVTHLFCVSNSSPKYETAMYFKEQTSVHVLLPHWFDDSVRLGVPIPVEPYEWPDPICLRPSTASQQDEAKDRERPQRQLTALQKARFRYGGCMANNENIPKGQSSNIWGGRRIVLSTTLDIAPSRRSAIESGIARCGGIIVPYLTNHGDGTRQEETDNVSNCDILVTKWRSGRAYVRAVRENKTIGTLGWVFCVHATGIVSRPMDQLLHYPIPRRPIENFSNHEITVTNYTGEAREYLKKLINTMGASFTPSMTGKNTVLIAAYLSGTKTTKAAAWSIPIVNHTWIEDCFIKWRNLTVGLEKYIYFPPGVDFSKFLGERGVGRGFAPAVTDADENNVGGWDALESEEDLDALEKEEDFFDAEMAGIDDEASVGGEVDRPLVIGQSSSPFRNRAANGIGQEVLHIDLSLVDMPLSSATASADAREVEAAMDPDDNDDVAKIDVSKDEESAKSSAPVQKNEKVKGEASKKYVLHAIEITKPLSSPRQGKVKAVKDDEKDDIEITLERRSSRLERAKTKEPSPKRDLAMKKGKGKAISLQQSEENDGVRSRGRIGKPAERLASKVAGGARDSSPKKSQAKQVNAISDSKNNVSKPKLGIVENQDDLDKTEEDEDVNLSAPRPSTRTKKAEGNVGKTQVRQEDESLSVKRSMKPKSVKTEARKTPSPKKKSEVDIKKARKQTVQEEEEEESDKEDISPTRSGKIRRKPVVVDEARISRRKSMGPSKPVKDSSPLPPPPESPTIIRTSKRSAALKATQRLHDEIMPDMNTYQRALKKGRISLGAEQEQLLRDKERVRLTPSNTSRKRKSTENSDDEEEFEVKRRRRVSFDHSTIESRKIDEDAKVKVERNIVLLTTQVNLTDDVEKALVKLGVRLTAKASECTHLIAPRIVRTEKFLAAVAGGPFILSGEWAKRSAAQKKLLPENDYALCDEAGEEKFSFKLKDAIERAKRGKVFAGKTFYVTPKVQADLQLLKNVIVSCGAQCYTTMPTVRILDANTNRHVISCPEDASIWRPIAAHHPIYNQELVLTSALKQLVEWDNYTFRVPGSF